MTPMVTGGTRRRPRMDGWNAPPDVQVPDAGDVHLWRVALDRPSEEVDRLFRTLSPDEQARATRYRWPRDRRRFVVGRAMLRAFLGGYLELAPASLAFAYGPAGKPALRLSSRSASLRFNVAHAGGAALYGFCVGRRVGVDLEAVRKIPNMAEVSRLVFSARERGELEAASEDQRTRAFLHGWTRKEAVLKARGDGLCGPLDRTEVSFRAGEGSLLRTLDGSVAGAAGWTLLNVPLRPGYVAAVAVEGARLRIVHRC